MPNRSPQLAHQLCRKAAVYLDFHYTVLKVVDERGGSGNRHGKQLERLCFNHFHGKFWLRCCTSTMVTIQNVEDWRSSYLCRCICIPTCHALKSEISRRCCYISGNPSQKTLNTSNILPAARDQNHLSLDNRKIVSFLFFLGGYVGILPNEHNLYFRSTTPPRIPVSTRIMKHF